MIHAIVEWAICYASAFALGFCAGLTLAYVYIKLAQI